MDFGGFSGGWTEDVDKLLGTKPWLINHLMQSALCSSTGLGFGVRMLSLQRPLHWPYAPQISKFPISDMNSNWAPQT